MRILGTTMVLLGSLIAASGHGQENAANKKDEITYRVGLDDYNHNLGPITALDVTSLAFITSIASIASIANGSK